MPNCSWSHFLRSVWEVSLISVLAGITAVSEVEEDIVKGASKYMLIALVSIKQDVLGAC